MVWLVSLDPVGVDWRPRRLPNHSILVFLFCLDPVSVSEPHMFGLFGSFGICRRLILAYLNTRLPTHYSLGPLGSSSSSSGRHEMVSLNGVTERSYLSRNGH